LPPVALVPPVDVVPPTELEPPLLVEPAMLFEPALVLPALPTVPLDPPEPGPESKADPPQPSTPSRPKGNNSKTLAKRRIMSSNSANRVPRTRSINGLIYRGSVPSNVPIAARASLRDRGLTSNHAT
jgi:hypothetical protein